MLLSCWFQALLKIHRDHIYVFFFYKMYTEEKHVDITYYLIIFRPQTKYFYSI